MKGKILLSMVILLLTVTVLLAASVSSGAEELVQKAQKISEEAFIKYDAKLYRQSIGLCERALSIAPNNSTAKYYLAYNQYRLLVISSTNKSDELFDDFFDSAVQNAESIRDKKDFKSEAKALLAAVYMMRLAKDPSEAPAISSKIYNLLGQAQEYDSLNPRVYLVKGIMLFHTPKMFGGSAQKAITNFGKALSLYKRDNKGVIRWGYLEALAWKGQALTKLQRLNEAEEVYNGALKAEPEFSWVKYVLLPALLKQKTKSVSESSENNEQVSTLNILIKNLSNDKGNIRIALSNSEENYESNKFYRRVVVSIKDKTAKYKFDNIPFGTYAIKFYHDENENQKLDKNLFGMPTEDYGFSNNATGSFGPASFKDAKFTVNKKVINIEMSAQ
ncbi:hypothetical protein BMS3Abin04_02477 [bacterium BMS3Abin04]|nr:hypothetical protein BMS3Abin04_02477 [bacterium BMS3Abin04]